MLPQGSKIERQEENPFGLTLRSGTAIGPGWSRIPRAQAWHTRDQTQWRRLPAL